MDSEVLAVVAGGDIKSLTDSSANAFSIVELKHVRWTEGI